MGQENNDAQGISRRDFFKLASAAGFGTAVGTYLFAVPGQQFKEVGEVSRHSMGVLFRIRDAEVSDLRSYSVAEMIMEPGSGTFVMYNDEAQVTFEGVSGQAIVLTDEEEPASKMQRAERSTRKTVKPGKVYQLVNPSKERAQIVQRFEPVWNTNKSFIKVGEAKIPGSDLWFELRETLGREETGLKYRLLRQTNHQVNSLVRVEPGVKGAVEYHKKSTHQFQVTQGSGIIVIEGKERELIKNKTVNIEPGTKYQLYNPYPNRWELSVKAKPGWLPDDSHYIVGNREIPGSDVWFGMRIG